MEGSEFRYAVEFDERVARKLGGRLYRSKLGLYLLIAVVAGGALTLISLALLMMISLRSTAYLPCQLAWRLAWEQSWPLALGNGLFCALVAVSAPSGLIGGEVRRSKGIRWENALTPDAFVVHAPGGSTHSYPWKAITLKREYPEAFVIDCGLSNPLTVYRKPLAEAGLEEEFRRRLGG